MTALTLAACQYKIDLIETWEDYVLHLTHLVHQAVERGAKLVLLPEYAGLVLAGQLDADTRSDLHGSIAAIQPLIPAWVELCEELARTPSSSSRVPPRCSILTVSTAIAPFSSALTV
jgi:predicted amidohydrolase